MADLTANSALAIKAQTAPETYASPGTSDAMPVANLSWRPTPIQSENPEYTGSIHRPGPIVLGASYDVTFDLLLRGPGGADVPAADAFIIGRVLRALGFTENRITAAIPASPEALASGTTTTATLGAGATGTADLYKGLALHLAALGSVPAGLVMITGYTAAKVATLAKTLGASASGNYQIPKQLAYTLASTGTPPLLSLALWQGSKRYNFVDMAPSSARLVFPTASRGGGSEYPRLSVTFSGDLHSEANEAAAAVTAARAVPPFKGGQQHVVGVPIGGSSISLDLGTRVGFPPNPNKASGSDPAQLTETRRTLQLDLNQVANSIANLRAIAEAQTTHPIQLLYGLASGNYVGFVATDARLNFPSVNAGGEFFTTTGEAYVDSAEKSISLVFPYY